MNLYPLPNVKSSAEIPKDKWRLGIIVAAFQRELGITLDNFPVAYKNYLGIDQSNKFSKYENDEEIDAAYDVISAFQSGIVTPPHTKSQVEEQLQAVLNNKKAAFDDVVKWIDRAPSSELAAIAGRMHVTYRDLAACYGNRSPEKFTEFFANFSDIKCVEKTYPNAPHAYKSILAAVNSVDLNDKSYATNIWTTVIDLLSSANDTEYGVKVVRNIMKKMKQNEVFAIILEVDLEKRLKSRNGFVHATNNDHRFVFEAIRSELVISACRANNSPNRQNNVAYDMMKIDDVECILRTCGEIAAALCETGGWSLPYDKIVDLMDRSRASLVKAIPPNNWQLSTGRIKHIDTILSLKRGEKKSVTCPAAPAAPAAPATPAVDAATKTPVADAAAKMVDAESTGEPRNKTVSSKAIFTDLPDLFDSVQESNETESVIIQEPAAIVPEPAVAKPVVQPDAGVVGRSDMAKMIDILQTSGKYSIGIAAIMDVAETMRKHSLTVGQITEIIGMMMRNGIGNPSEMCRVLAPCAAAALVKNPHNI